MKKISNLLMMALLTIGMGLTSCDDILGQFDNPFGPLSISVNSIDLDADEMTLTVGDVGQLIATVGPENATDKTVTWTSSKESVATVDATGKVTAVAEGTATIKAKAGSISTTCIVTVKAATVAVTSVTLDKTELALTIGDAAVQLTATVTPDNATDAAVDWESSDLSVATVDGSGLVTAVADGTATITAKAGGKTATCTVTVSKKAGSISFAVTAINKTIGDAAFKNAPTIEGDGTVESYSSSDTDVATVATDGTVTIKGAGSTTITVKVANGAKNSYSPNTASYTVTVSKKAGSISYTTTEISKFVGDAAFTNALTKVGDGTVSYASDNTAVATVNATTGEVTIVGAGTATITVTVADSDTYTYATTTASYTVTVKSTGSLSDYKWNEE